MGLYPPGVPLASRIPIEDGTLSSSGEAEPRRCPEGRLSPRARCSLIGRGRVMGPRRSNDASGNLELLKRWIESPLPSILYTDERTEERTTTVVDTT